MTKKILITISLLLVLVIGVIGWMQRVNIKDAVNEWRNPKAEVPSAVSYVDIIQNSNSEIAEDAEIENNNENAETNANNSVEETIEIPTELNLDIPFTSQAPLTNWDALHGEACEEASALMAARFLQGRPITDVNDADTAIVTLVKYNEDTLKQKIDTTAEETAYLIEEFYDLNTEVIYDWSWDDVKTALAQGYPVIFPAAGRELGNPNFTSPGPIYHMLVIKGYTEDHVITNDPGTRRGADYTYSYDTLMSANHDWDPDNITDGAKVILIVKP